MADSVRMMLGVPDKVKETTSEVADKNSKATSDTVDTKATTVSEEMDNVKTTSEVEVSDKANVTSDVSDKTVKTASVNNRVGAAMKFGAWAKEGRQRRPKMDDIQPYPVHRKKPIPTPVVVIEPVKVKPRRNSKVKMDFETESVVSNGSYESNTNWDIWDDDDQAGTMRNSKSESDILQKDSLIENDDKESASVRQQSPSSISATGTSTNQESLKQENDAASTPGRRGRGGGTRGGRRRGGRGGRDANPGVTYDDLDFHSSWFASMGDPYPFTVHPQLFGPLMGSMPMAMAGPTGVEGSPNMPPPIYLSRDSMLRLSYNINNGLAYVSQAFELARLGAQELQEAKLTLERMYLNQHQNVDNETANANSNANLVRSTAPAEPVQVHIDPYQYHSVGEMAMSGVVPAQEIFKDIVNAVISGTGRRRKPEEPAEGCSTTKKRQKRQPTPQFTSKYNSNLAKIGFQTLVNHLTAKDGKVPGDSSNNRCMVIPLTDVRPAMDRSTAIRPNVFSAGKIRAIIKRDQRNKKRPNSANQHPHTNKSSTPHWRTIPVSAKVTKTIREGTRKSSRHSLHADPVPATTPEKFAKQTDTNNNPNSPRGSKSPVQTNENEEMLIDEVVAAINECTGIDTTEEDSCNMQVSDGAESQHSDTNAREREDVQSTPVIEINDSDEEEMNDLAEKVCLPEFKRSSGLTFDHHDNDKDIKTTTKYSIVNGLIINIAGTADNAISCMSSAESSMDGLEGVGIGIEELHAS